MFLPAPKHLDLEQLDPDALATEVRIVRDPDGLGIVLVDGSGRQVAYQHIDGDDADFVLTRTAPAAAGQAAWDEEAVETARTVSRVSRELLTSVSADAITTAKRLTTSFDNFIKMLWWTFGFGLAAFAVAVLRGFTATDTTDVVVAGIFGGLSASTFVATFIARPTGAMGDAGPRAAWVQGIVTTYWAKLAYMNDPDTVLNDLDAAQQSLAGAMREYTVAVADRPAQNTEQPAAQDTVGQSSPAAGTPSQP